MNVIFPCQSVGIARSLMKALKAKWDSEHEGEGGLEVDKDTADTFRAHSNWSYYEVEFSVQAEHELVGVSYLETIVNELFENNII